jgi:hypothetical protein
VAEPQRTHILRLAVDKVKILLQNMEQDQVTMKDQEDGKRAFQAVVDAARGTVDNLNRALDDSASSGRSD